MGYKVSLIAIQGKKHRISKRDSTDMLKDKADHQILIFLRQFDHRWDGCVMNIMCRTIVSDGIRYPVFRGGFNCRRLVANFVIARIYAFIGHAIL